MTVGRPSEERARDRPRVVLFRGYEPRDEAAVLGLVDADRLAGQPWVTAAMLGEALAGRSEKDADWWEELDEPVTVVAIGDAGEVVGVVSYALRREDDTGLILWLHCRESLRVAEALVGHAVEALAPRAVDAFHIASALSLGLEALPVGRRPATRDALERAGFVGERRWRYLHRGLPAPELPRVEGVVLGADRRLVVREGGDVVAEALVGTRDGCGALWWIGVEEHARRRGLGRRLLGSALDALHGLGAGEVMLLLDDADDATEDEVRDRRAAGALYARAGFGEVDRLYAYTLARADRRVSADSKARRTAPRTGA